MEGAIKPDVPITATKSMEEEQQRAQADALYRLQVTMKQEIFSIKIIYLREFKSLVLTLIMVNLNFCTA